MTRHDSSPYRAPDAPKPPAVRRRFTEVGRLEWCEETERLKHVA